MTTYIVDRKKIQLEVQETETLGSLYSKFEQILSEEGRVIHQIKLDKTVVSPFEIDEKAGTLIKDILSIEVTTSTPQQYSSQVLTESKEELDAVSGKLNIIADYLSKGDLAQAKNLMKEVTNTLQDFFKFLDSFGRIFKIDIDTVEIFKGTTVKQHGEHFLSVLRQVHSSMENNDLVSVSDAVIYEMIPAVKQFGGLAKTLKKMLK